MNYNQKIKSFEKSNLMILRTEFAKAVAGVEKTYGIKFDLGNISFLDKEFTSRLKVYIVDPKLVKSGDPNAAKKLRFAENVRKHGWKMGINVKDLGKLVELGRSGLCEFVGCKDRDSKMPLIFETEDGKLIRASKSFLPKG